MSAHSTRRQNQGPCQKGPLGDASLLFRSRLWTERAATRPLLHHSTAREERRLRGVPCLGGNPRRQRRGHCREGSRSQHRRFSALRREDPLTCKHCSPQRRWFCKYRHKGVISQLTQGASSYSIKHDPYVYIGARWYVSSLCARAFLYAVTAYNTDDTLGKRARCTVLRSIASAASRRPGTTLLAL